MKTIKKRHLSDVIRINNQIYPIADIVMFEANVNYTFCYFNDGKKLMCAKTIKSFEGQFNHHGFLRVHRAYIINSAYLSGYSRHKNYITMQNNVKINISRRRKEALDSYLFLQKAYFAHIF